MIKRSKRLQSVQEYYFSAKLREVAQLQAQGHPIINMGIGSPDLQPQEEVVAALVDSLSLPKAHQYQSYQGLPELRAGFKHFYETIYQVGSTNLDFLPLMGSKEGIMHLALTFLDEGDQVLIPNPGYPTYAAVCNLVKAKAVYYDLVEKNNYQPDFEALEQLDLSAVKMMWVNYPHMPTGAKATQETLEKIIAFGKKHQILIVNDNPYSLILNNQPQSIFNIAGAEDIALELNSLSKSFNLSGWRVGVVVGHPNFLNDVLKVKSNFDSGMFFGVQKGAIKALEAPVSWFEKINLVYKKRQELIFLLAKALNLTFDEAATGMFVWCKLPVGVDANAFVDDLLYNKHIFITPGHIFGSNGKDYVRFSLCVEESKIQEALNRIQHD